jgi:hypothetical protein
MKAIKFYVLLFLLIFSCQTDKRKENTAALVAKWQGKKIVFPEHMVFTRYGIDTVDYQIPDSEYKVLIYVDSTGCTGCKLQLDKWKEMIAYTNGEIPFLFFFYPRDHEELYYLLDMERFDIPVCVDTADELNQINKFSTDIEFQTFLLNQRNEVLVIGNPIDNSEMKNKYWEYIKN